MTRTRTLRPASRNAAQRRAQTGSTLIEVLVAALILSIGIMALIGVQGSSVQMAKMAQQRGDAARLAQDFADRVRANMDRRGDNLGAYLSAVAYNGNVAAQAVPAGCKGVATCAPADIAQLDLAEMREQARLLLPNGAFFITRENIGAAPNITQALNIWVIWQTAATKSDDTGTLTGIGCPAGAVTAGTKSTQCLLTRVML